MTPFIHPNTPPKLVRLFKKLECKYHRVADTQGVNVAHVYKLINSGKEPKSPDIRRALFLPRNPRKPGRAPKPQTPIQKAIRRMAKETNDAVIRRKSSHL